MKIPALLVILASVATAVAQDKVPLQTELPKPVVIGTAQPIKLDNLEPAAAGKRPDFLVAATATNVAEGKDVTSSAMEPLLGDFTMITDGDKDSVEGSYVELPGGTQWVQIDLGQETAIDAVLVWHFHAQARAYFGVVVQVSNDPDFISGVTTIFNNDTKNLVGQGAGTDKNYIENYEGKLIDAKGVKGRYVRLYSQGNTANSLNHYIEVEVWGTPVK